MVNGELFRQLGDAIDHLESHGLEVQDVSTTGGVLLEDDGLCVEVTATLGFLESVTEKSGAVIHAQTGDDVPSSIFEVEIPADESKRTNLSLADKETQVANRVGTNSEVTPKASENEGSTVVDAEGESEQLLPEADTEDPDHGKDDVPYYNNEELLASVYEECDTFSDMTDSLGVDVTPATVRQHMVNKGIHPDSSAESNEDDLDTDEDESNTGPDDTRGTVETAETDGYGLPEDLSLEMLVDAVVDAQTLYEFRTELDLEDDTARNLLRDLNLLDLITSRLATKNEKTVTPDTVRERIRSATRA